MKSIGKIPHNVELAMVETSDCRCIRTRVSVW